MTDYSSQTVAQLKDVLKERGLSTDGKKADLVQRLTENDTQSENPPQEESKEAVEEPTEASNQEPTLAEPVEQKEPGDEVKTEDHEEKSEKPQPKVLSPEERKQLAVDLLTKKVQRAEKFGDEAAADAAKKDLARVEKFGVELGTAIAREIGLVNKNLNEGLKPKFHGKKKFKNRKFKNGKKFKRH